MARDPDMQAYIRSLLNRIHELETTVHRMEGILARSINADTRIRELEAKLAKVGPDPWEQTIIEYLAEQKGWTWRHSTETLLEVVGERLGNRDAEIRIRAIMLKLDWRPGLVPTYGDKRVRGYVMGSDTPSPEWYKDRASK